jgi:hypothetical protein
VLDRSLGHKRRYNVGEARRLMESQGFTVETAGSFNKVAALPWLAYSRVLGLRRINKPVLKIFDKSVWFWRRLDPLMPWPGLSLIVTARKNTTSRAPSLQQVEAARNAN